MKSIALIIRQFYWRLGRKLYIYSRGDISIEPGLSGEYYLIKELFKIISHKITVFDVGANIGEWTTYAVKIAALNNIELEAYLFEAAQDSFLKLTETFQGRGFNINRFAITDMPGVANLHVIGDFAGRNSLYIDPKCSALRTERVLAISLDEYAFKQSIVKVDFIKIDTEGNDFKVLLGAKKLFTEGSIGVCQFEYNHRWVYARSFLKDVFELIPIKLYVVAKVMVGSLEVYDEWHPELEKFFECNYVIIKRDHPLLIRNGVFVRFNESNIPIPL